MVGEDVSIAPAVRIGAHVVVHDGTQVGEGCVLDDHSVLGKLPRLGARSSAATGAAIDGLVLESGVTVCTAAVVFAGSVVGAGAILGDQSYVRERVRLGPGALVGRGSAVDNDVTVGARVRIQTGVYLTAFSEVEDDVFLGPGACTTNDNTMGRHGPQKPLRGAALRRACRIGARSVLLPGIEVGEEAFVAAGSVVTRDVPARAVVMGTPARVVGEVGDEDLLERWS
jgi:acetyltransferase-like isoleucine patch superfamily enzyme